jgi:hypothetical protein
MERSDYSGQSEMKHPLSSSNATRRPALALKVRKTGTPQTRVSGGVIIAQGDTDHDEFYLFLKPSRWSNRVTMVLPLKSDEPVEKSTTVWIVRRISP